MSALAQELDPKFDAACEYVWRSMPMPSDVRYRFSGEEEPIVWIVVAEYSTGACLVEAGLDYLSAILKLCERITYGATCPYCSRPAAFDPNLLDLPVSGPLCWTLWDPELRVFRRNCE